MEHSMEIDREIEHKIMEIPVDQLGDASGFFKNLTGVDLDHIPRKYGDSVLRARRLVENSVSVRCIYGYFGIAEKEKDRVVLDNGLVLEGKIVPRFLKNAERGVCHVATLEGYEDMIARASDLMEQYFADCWATALIQAAQAACRRRFQEEIGAEEKLTHTWSPGQYHFDLKNQRPVFAMLRPGEIGVRLNSYCKMDPVKSVSGVLGIISAEDTYDLLPCTFCSFAPSCPSSKEGCDNY